MDIWVENSAPNAQAVFAALKNYGAPLTGISMADFEANDTIYPMGRAPVRVDIFTGVEGVDFAPCWERRVTTSFEGVTAFILSKQDLIAAKTSSARPQDLLDVAALQDI